MLNLKKALIANCSLLAALTGDMMAVTVQVGTCRTTVPSFATIQSAVNAAPAGSTILVCPGTYPEQVTINKDLTVRGVRSGILDEAIIVAPAGGITANTTSLATGNPIAAQVLVTAAKDVDISNLTIDGSNNGINACSPNLIGLYYQNASGNVRHIVAVNQALVSAVNGCQSGLAVFVQSGHGGNSRVTVSDSHVQNYQKNGITGNENGTTINVLENTVIGQGPTTGAAENSIQIGFGAKGRVISNVAADNIFAPDTIADPGDAASGIIAFASSDVVVSDNTVSNSQFGIAFVSDTVAGSADDGTITSNRVSATHIFDGIDLCSSANRVHDNIVNGSGESGIHLDTSCGKVSGNRVSDNTINGACAGILVGTGSGSNNINNNAFFNVRNTVLSADECTPPPFSARSAASLTTARSPKYSPARP